MKNRQLLFLGDIHHEFREIGFYIKERYKIENADIIQVGDFGAGFYKINYYNTELKRLNEILKKLNNKMYVIRGNHDDPSFFDGSWKLSNLELIPDNTVLELEDESIFCLGGAVSVDRIRRIKDGHDGYWENEKIAPDWEKIKKLRGLTGIVAHSCPDFAPPIRKSNIEFALKNDSSLLADLNEERDTLTKVFHELALTNNLSFWCYGHFHGNEEMSNKPVDIFDTAFKFLDINEFFSFDE